MVARNLAEQADPQLIEMVLVRASAMGSTAICALSTVFPGEASGRRLIDQLVCACDVYTWKLLRRDMGRSRADTETTVLDMVKAIVRAA